MRRHRRAIVVTGLALGLALVAGVAYLGAGFSLYDGLSKVTAGCGTADTGGGPRFATVTPATLDYTANDFGAGDLTASMVLKTDVAALRMPDYQDVSFPSRTAPGTPSATIRGWWVPGPTADAPAVILVHGRDSCRKDWNVLLPAAMLHRAGFATLLIDLRNHGDSDLTSGPTRGRYYAGVVEYLDVLGAWDWLVQDRGIAPSRIGLVGTSLGAGSVLLAAAHEPRVAAVWEDSSYADIQQRAAEEIEYKTGLPLGFLAPAGGIAARLAAGIDIYGETPLTAMTAMAGRPLEIVHGAGDVYTRPHHAQDLYDAAVRAGVDAGLWIIPYAGHTWGPIVAPAEYERRLAAFFGEHLGGPTSSLRR